MKNLLVAVAVSVIFTLPSVVYAEAVEEQPTAFAMAGDVLIARPLGLVVLGVGSAVWVASLPFSIFGGNAGESAKTLVIGPLRETFVRCLGCTRLGRKEKLKTSRTLD